MNALHVPLPAAPLPVGHARQARRAGAVAGALVGVGLPLAASPLVAWALAGYFAWVAGLPTSDVEPDTRAIFGGMLDLLATPVAIVLQVVCVAIGGLLVAAGIVLAGRRLRRAGVRRPVGVVLLGLLLARVGTFVIGGVLSGLPDVLAVVWLPPMLGIAFSDAQGASEGTPMGPVVVGAGILVGIVGVVAGAGSWLGVGILTTWWMAVALRDRRPLAAAPWGAPVDPRLQQPAPTWAAETRARSDAT